MNTQSWALVKPAGHISRQSRDWGGVAVLAGHVITPHGVVLVECADNAKRPYTLLRFALGGREYSYTETRAFSARYLTTLAARVIAAAAEESQDE